MNTSRPCLASSESEKKMDGKKLPGPLFVVVDEKTIPAAVQQAIGWALVTACGAVASLAVGYAVAYALAHYYGTFAVAVSCSQSSFLLRCVALTDAQAAEQSAFWFGWLCCALLQAAAAVMALRIPCHRRALAYLALVVTFVGHCMYAAGLRPFLAADPGFLFGWIVGPATIVISAGGDLVFFLGLLRHVLVV